MGVDLLSNNNVAVDTSMNWSGWRKALELATLYGWNPEGTRETKYEEIARGLAKNHVLVISDGPDVGYFTNGFQMVSDSDAFFLGQALLRAVDADPAKAHWLSGIIAIALCGSFLIG